MQAFFGAELQSGVQIVIMAVKLRERLKGADLCITGEGKLDAQSLAGKTPIGVARVCREMKVPCVALVGAVGEGAEGAIDEGLGAYYSICDRPMVLEEAMSEAPRLLAGAAWKLMRTVRAARGNPIALNYEKPVEYRSPSNLVHQGPLGRAFGRACYWLGRSVRGMSGH